MEQLHKRFTNEQVKDLMQRYINKELKREHIQEMLQIRRRQFFKLLQEYRDHPKGFSIEYNRESKTRSIAPAIEKNILKELKDTKALIDNKSIPVWSYNYNFIRKNLEASQDQKVSLQTIINKAKQHGFYIDRSKQHKAHDREVITNNIGELTQHDSSFHQFSPLVGQMAFDYFHR